MIYSSKLTLNPSRDKWYPHSIENLVEHLHVLIKPNDYFSYSDINPLMKNIAYSLQYIEFLNQVNIDINLSMVLQNQNVKSFIVHGASIIEAIFNYIVISSGNGNTTKLFSIKKLRSPHYQIGDKEYLNEIEIFECVDDEIKVPMTFDQLAKKVESKKLLGKDFQKYPQVSKIRKLRNKIHIHDNDNIFDTDWWNFSKEEYILIKSTLHAMLTSSLFEDSDHLSKFDYLSC